MGQYFCKLYRQKEIRVLMQGLDASGKTTILYFLKLGEVVTSIPTIGFNVELLRHKNISLTAWDLGGRDKIRPLFRHYYPNTDAMIFVIDSGDRERLDQITDELTKALEETELRDSIFLILANKQDLDSAMSLEKIKQGINYDKIKRDYNYRIVNIFGCSAVTKDGQKDLNTALDWLCTELAPPRKGWFNLSSDKSVRSTSGDKTNPDSDNTDTGKIIPDDSEPEKTPWTLGAYMKGTIASFKSVFPNLW